MVVFLMDIHHIDGGVKMDIEKAEETLNELIEESAKTAAKALRVYCDMHETCEGCQFHFDKGCRIDLPEWWDIRDEEM